MRQAYGFHPCYRPCPACRGRLSSTTPLTRRQTQGLLHQLGFSCFCQGCGSRFRAVGRIRYSVLAWLGPTGRWLWWQFTRLEATTPPPQL